MRILTKLAVLLLILQAISSEACTIAVVSGKHTADGRPLLWKNRDSEYSNNLLVYLTEGKYRAIALMNAGDREQAWGGMNEEGFAIINSYSDNLNYKDTAVVMPYEGFLIKKALENCASAEDFERMLYALKKPYGLCSNFAVTDAAGNAFLFEVSNYKIAKYSANDPLIAPHGFIVRANYSASGARIPNEGYDRQYTAEKLIRDAIVSGTLNDLFLAQNMSRCLLNLSNGTDLRTLCGKPSGNIEPAEFLSYIPHYNSASALTIRGIREGESPLNAVMWTSLGFPLTSVAYPVWFNKAALLPGVLQAGTNGRSFLCTMANRLKDRSFPYHWQQSHNIINMCALYNSDSTGFVQKLAPLEQQIISDATSLMEGWEACCKYPNEAEILEFYAHTDREVTAAFLLLAGKLVAQ